jgi:hypothetical protein
MRCSRSRVRAVLFVIPLVVTLFSTGAALAYEQYSTSRTTGNCATCHGGFRSNPYTSQKPGEGDWPGDLHDVHRYDMLNGDCEACHGSGSRFPVRIGISAGGLGLPAISCSGCHGRAEDGSGSGSVGYGAGLRQHHWRAGETECVDCHDDSNPTAFTTASEDTLPPYYFTIDPSHPTKPTDPCNPSPDFIEGSFAATTLGLDNDGDGSYDGNDSDCATATAGPGETSTIGLAPMLVTSRDAVMQNLGLSYEHPCDATDNVIEYGPLTDVSLYGYSGQQCAVGSSGSYVWSYPAGDLFFLVVANNGSVEGSYGLDAAQVERPEDNTSASCPLPQELTNRCDP